MLGREGAGPGTITGCGSQAAHVPGSAGQADSLLLPIAPDDQAVGLVTTETRRVGVIVLLSGTTHLHSSQ